MPFVETAQKPVADFSDDFEETTLRPEWSWNYPYATVNAHVEKGRLRLSGQPITHPEAGAALCLRPTSAQYRIETAVLNHDESWKGLTLYGDDQNWISIGCQADKVAIKLRRDGKEQLLAEQRQPGPVTHLRMEVSEGIHCRFLVSRDGRHWQAIPLSLPDESTRALTRWDRIARPGLYQSGQGEGCFGYVRLTQ